MLGDGSPFDISAAPDPQAGEPSQVTRGVLCIHGFTGSPFEMRYLGESLAGRGYRAVGPTLSGHCTNPSDLNETGWRDWYAGVKDSFLMLRAECQEVAVVGHSLGGLLALHLAKEHGRELAAVAALSAPLWLGRLPTLLLKATRPGRLLARIVRNLPKIKGSDTRDLEMKKKNPGYRVFPLRALHELSEFMNMVRADLEQVAIPTLVVHAIHDHTAPFAGSYELCARVQRGTHRKLERSFHNITVDVERDIVAREVGDFFEARFREQSAVMRSHKETES